MAVEWIEYKTVKEGKRKERKYNRKSDKYKLNENKKKNTRAGKYRLNDINKHRGKRKLEKDAYGAINR